MAKRTKKKQWNLEGTIEEALREIVRVLMPSINYTQAAECIRELYVQEAYRILSRPESESKPTKSAISVMTNIDPRAFPSSYRFQESEMPPPLTRSKVPPEITLLDDWSTNRRLIDRKTGKPKVLPIMGDKSFDMLAQKHYPRGVTAQTVLNKLVRSGNVQRVGLEQVKLVDPVYVPMDENSQETVGIGMLAIRDLASTVHHNLQGGNERRFQRQIESGNINEDDVEKIQTQLDKALSSQSEDGRKRLEKLSTKHAGGNAHIGVGYYYFQK